MLARDRIFSAHVELSSRRGRIFERNRLEQDRYVAEPALRPAIDRKTLRPFKFAIDERNIELKCEAIVDRVAGDKLRDRTVLVLAGRIRDFASTQQHRPKVRELFGDGGVKSVPPRLR